jgi:transcription-repair coupling factor (superfamily II helicase)
MDRLVCGDAGSKTGPRRVWPCRHRGRKAGRRLVLTTLLAEQHFRFSDRFADLPVSWPELAALRSEE